MKMTKRINFKDIILFENEDYIVVNKPPFISTLDDRGLGTQNILSLAKEYHADSQVCHRIDKETSGILVIAKNAEAYRNLAMQFEHRQVEKVYHAVVNGVHDFKGILVDLPIYTLSRGVVKIDRLRGKEAQTIFNTIRAFKKHTLVECVPVTGRMHQIRVHLAQLEASIAGDEQYGGEPVYLSSLKKHFNLKKDTEERPVANRFALHAWSIEFRLPNGDILYYEAPYPKDFEVLVRQLGKYS
ncbi:RNA pseudouridine synthase [Cytophagaceae bacterium ABcell3]|nr:RNA pseudouridine synthase [Cytophagaceae bacterium ABcell3]